MSGAFSELPLISIVMPSLNQGQFIEQAINSVLGQNYPNFELIVIDGGSTDHTIDVLKQYDQAIKYWVSEPDRGQANAINKGFRLAQGDILAWLNSDDMYLPCTFAKIAEHFKDGYDLKLVYGGCLHFCQGQAKGAYGYLPHDFDVDKLTYFDYIVQPSTFWSKSLWQKVGELNEDYYYVLDWDWFIRASKLCTFTPLHDYLSIYRYHEDHKTSTGGSKRTQELMKIVEIYADEAWICAYKDVCGRAEEIRVGLKRLAKFKLYRFRRLFYPKLYFKHGHDRIRTALQVL